MNTLTLLAALTVFRVDPWYHEPILPDADPKCGVETDTFPFAAAKGEFEAISFVVKPDRDIPKVDVVPSDLTGPGGAKIPADAADVTLVKVWFRPGGRWVTSYAGNIHNPQPINNLLLHDDAVVKVDFENKINKGLMTSAVAQEQQRKLEEQRLAEEAAPFAETCRYAGFSFSYPCESLPGGDGIVLRLCKELRVEGAEDVRLGLRETGDLAPFVENGEGLQVGGHGAKADHALRPPSFGDLLRALERPADRGEDERIARSLGDIVVAAEAESADLVGLRVDCR